MKKAIRSLILAALVSIPVIALSQSESYTVADGYATNWRVPMCGSNASMAQHVQIIYDESQWKIFTALQRTLSEICNKWKV